MRRRFWLVLLAVAAALMLVVAIVLPRNRAPFEFLEGRRPLTDRPLPGGFRERVYWFEADFKAMENPARRELIRSGLTDATKDIALKAGFYFHTEDVRGGGPWPRPTWGVLVVPDRRIVNFQVWDVVEKKGWVYVLVTHREEPGLLEKLQRWLGL